MNGEARKQNDSSVRTRKIIYWSVFGVTLLVAATFFLFARIHGEVLDNLYYSIFIELVGAAAFFLYSVIMLIGFEEEQKRRDQDESTSLSQQQHQSYPRSWI